MVSFCSLSSFLLSFSFVYLLQVLNFIDAQAQAQAYDYPTTATLSTKWTNNGKANHSIQYEDGSTGWPILLRAKDADGLAYYAYGFFCDGNCNTYFLAILIVQVPSGGSPSQCGRTGAGGRYTPCIPYGHNPYDRSDSYGRRSSDGVPQVVWSANRNNPVKIGATLELTSEGDLMLKDADGTVAWSTNTSGKSVVGLNLTDLGSLELFNKNNVTIWRSFDEPTDSLVLGQKLMAGQRLMPSVSETNWTADSMISFSMNSSGLFAQMETSPPQIYYQYLIDNPDSSNEFPYLEFVNGSLDLFSNSTTNESVALVPRASSAQYMKLGSDGHLRVYEWEFGWKEVADLLTGYASLRGNCAYPTVCGPYGICSNEQCSCPAPRGETSYFKPVDDRQPTLGCFENVPLSCGALQYHSLLELENVTYFSFTPDLKNIDASSCQEVCAKNCSCKAAIFHYESNPTNGSCYLPTQVFSLINIDRKVYYYSYNSTVYLKVQNRADQVPNTSVENRRSNRLPVVLGSSLGALFATMLLIVIIVLFVRKGDDNEVEEDYLDQVPGMPSRFTYNDLKAATDDFSKKLGEGGFGSVFEGTLIDDTKVAVKRLDGFGQVKKSFLAEVETIGSIHHVNLVRLIGFCAEKSHRLLIYEYMSNGSLDKWIFRKSNECVLNWQQRKKIILDIAKGLNYLHEDCRQKIVHLDIKPQNILLDGNFNAKVADFGLSKLIDKDQSRVVTTMRGTPGYLAPEWLSAAITEKVDVYSFGVVILEIVCGRKIFDRSLNEEDMHLLSLFKRKAEEEQMLDIVDDYSEDMQLNGPQAVNMLKIAAWCLQGDYTRRPSMSTVIKVLEGVSEVQDHLDYNFSTQPSTSGAAKFGQMEVEFSATTALLPSVLSGPR